VAAGKPCSWPQPAGALPACAPRLQAEKRLSELVVGGSLTARIDRPAGIVRFAKRR
jgi:hypothetical protein